MYRLFCLAIALLSYGYAFAASKLSDSDIKSILEAKWNNDSATIYLGNFAVLGGSPFESGEVEVFFCADCTCMCIQ